MLTNRTVLTVVLVFLLAGTAAAGGSREAGDLIGPEEAFEMVQAGEAILVDVRDEASYAEVHIAGAILVPYGTVAAAADDLASRGRTIITYCACPAEESSAAAAAELITRGMDDVLVLKGGIREWAVAGYPLKSGSRP